MKPPWIMPTPGISYHEKSTSAHHCSVSNGLVQLNATTARLASTALSASTNACVV